jgi:glutathione S-transferase
MWNFYLANFMVDAYWDEDEVRKRNLKQKLFKETIPKNLGYFEAKAAQNKSGYLIGDSLTWVDLYLIVILDW